MLQSYQESNPLLSVLNVELDGLLLLSMKVGSDLKLVASQPVKLPLELVLKLLHQPLLV